MSLICSLTHSLRLLFQTLTTFLNPLYHLISPSLSLPPPLHSEKEITIRKHTPFYSSTSILPIREPIFISLMTISDLSKASTSMCVLCHTPKEPSEMLPFFYIFTWLLSALLPTTTSRSIDLTSQMKPSPPKKNKNKKLLSVLPSCLATSHFLLSFPHKLLKLYTGIINIKWEHFIYLYDRTRWQYIYVSRTS